MTKSEAAKVLVSMVGKIQSECEPTDWYSGQMHEAVAMACAELMIDEILADRSKAEVVSDGNYN